MKLTGAELIIRLLEREGVGIVCGVPGGAALPLYDALGRSRLIRHVLARHEQGAGFIAQGIARASGQPAVCLASSGPGATNLVTAVADAKLDSVPLVAITGQVNRRAIGTDAFQEVDAFGLAVPITKHNYLVGSVRELLTVVPRAFAIARSGRPGPVWIDVPKDVQTDVLEIGDEDWPAPSRETCVAAAPAATDADVIDAVRAAAAMIDGARRPVLYVGGGAVHAGVAHSVRALAEKSSLPTTLTLMGLGALPADHPLSLGMLGMHGARYTNLVLEECDLLIALGARFDDRATGNLAEFCPNADVVHLDIDPSELGKLRRPEVAVAGDLARTLPALLARVTPRSRPDWLARVDELRRSFPLVMPEADDPRSPYGLIRSVAALLPEDAIVTTDVGQHQMWAAQAYPVTRARRWLTSGGLGTMGFGMPAAIGAALACPDSTVVCFTGDGSLLMNIQDLATAADQGVNVKIVLMNNEALGLVHQQQTLFYGERVFASTYPRPTDFVAVARGFGIDALDLSGVNDPCAALGAALTARGPCLIHARIETAHQVLPMVPPGAANREMIGGLA